MPIGWNPLRPATASTVVSGSRGAGLDNRVQSDLGGSAARGGGRDDGPRRTALPDGERHGGLARKTPPARFALAALAALPVLAREAIEHAGLCPDGAAGPRADVELEHDGEAWFGFGSTSPNWTDESVVNFEAPAGGPWVVAEVRMYIAGTEEKNVHFWDSPALASPPSTYVDGPAFSTPYSAWPPADWTTVDVTGEGMVANDGDIVAPGPAFYGTDDGIGLADAFADGNAGHSWVLDAGGWEDDTYVWTTDDGIRLGLNTAGGAPVEETTWGQVKGLFR